MSHAIRISCSRSNLKTVRDFVADVLRAHQLSDIQQNQIILAVDEIVANLIIHSNHEDDSKHLDIRVDVADHEFRFEAEDDGQSYSPADYRAPDLQEHIRLGKKGGVGMALVNRIMDRVEFSTEGTRNFCRLSKRLS